jgi:hypothetical protein
MASRKTEAAPAEDLFPQEGESAWDDLTEGAVEEAPPEDIEVSLVRDVHEPMSVGTHRVRAQFRGIGQGAAGPYLRMRYECIEEGPEEGFEATDNLSLSPKAKFKMDAFLDAVGLPRTGKVMASSFDGKELIVTIGMDEYQGTVRPKVEAYLPLTTPVGGGTGKLAEFA